MTAGFAENSLLSVEVRRVACASSLVIALDFDGTLAPLVDDPDDSRAEPASVRAMERLAELPGVTLALVSGRSLASLDIVGAGLPGTIRIGSHGAEWQGAHAAEGWSPTLVGGTTPLREAMESFPLDGARLEHKPYGVVLHTRGLDPDVAQGVQERARAAVTRLPVAPAIRMGKDVLDFSVAVTGKDQAIRRLREETHADALLFIGDDVTDEDGFAALTPADLGVKVGPGATRATVRVDGPSDVAGVLELVADVRASVD